MIHDELMYDTHTCKHNNIYHNKHHTMQSLYSKLTPYYQNHLYFRHLAERIDNCTIMTSFLLSQYNNKLHLLHKDGEIHAPFDWQLFSLMRASAKLSITSGNVVRAEKGVFMKRESYGDPEVDKLFESIVGDRIQKLMLLCQEMTQQQLATFVNSDLYKIVQSPVVTSKTEFFQQIAEKYESPIVLELGLSFLHPYYEQVRKGGKNSIDLIMLSRFQGQLDQKYVGNEFKIPLEMYKLAWKSELHPCQLSNGIKGQLRFETYVL